MTEIELREGERVDDIGFGGLKLIQAPEEFCYGIDAVLLADFAAKTARRSHAKLVADLGTGTGVIPIILAKRAPFERGFGIEIQEKAAERTTRSVRMNGFDGREGAPRITVLCADVADFTEAGEAEELLRLRGSFDLVTSNPPYVERGAGQSNDAEALKIARAETTADVFDFFRAASALLHRKGSFCLIHRPARLADIFAAARETNLEPKEMQLVRPKEGKEPNLVLLRFVKDGGRELHYLPDLAVYGRDGAYTEEILRAYERI